MWYANQGSLSKKIFKVFKWFWLHYVSVQIWNHPDILYNLIQKKKSITDDNDLDIETENGTGTKKKRCVKKKPQKSPQPVDQYYPPYERGQEISYEWVIYFFYTQYE